MERGTALLARRESAKVDKRRRIEAAARAVFREHGYERASLREIAKRAGVATGTLFLYARDKRNLLVWIINVDLERLTEPILAELSGSRAGDALIDQLMYLFACRYRYWSTDRDLGLHAMQEVTFDHDGENAPGSHFPYYRLRRDIVRDFIAELVRGHQRHGRVRAGEPADAIARLIMAIYTSAVRIWLREPSRDVENGLAELRLLFRLALDGVSGSIARGADGRSN